MSDDEIRRIDVRIEQIDDEWCAIHKSDRELARSKEKKVLLEYLSDAIPTTKKDKSV